MNDGLSARLRRETAEAHRAAERSSLVRDMLAGCLRRPRYLLMLRNLVPVYQVLERHDAPPVLPGFSLASVARSEALADDLTTLYGAGWADDVPLLSAGAAYRDRLTELAGRAPLLLAAHAYVRYLGDLSGGRMLGRAMRRSLGTDGSAGLAFYEFPLVTSVESAKAGFRRALDALPDAHADALVAEAREGFELNLRLFEAVAAEPLDEA